MHEKHVPYRGADKTSVQGRHLVGEKKLTETTNRKAARASWPQGRPQLALLELKGLRRRLGGAGSVSL